jgi:RNA polymerase sigma-70 factor (ECF subfamily)
MLENQTPMPLGAVAEQAMADTSSDAERRMTNHEEVERLLAHLEGPESHVVRMYHLEGKTYQEISRITGMPTNSVGPMLSRIRSRLRGQSRV